MKKVLVILAAVAAVVVVAAVIALANINRIIESQRDTILARVEDELGRPVTVGEIGATLWPRVGVRVEGVSVPDDPRFADAPLVSADAVRVNLRLRPLLRKRVEVTRLVLERPRLSLVRSTDGTLNASTLATPQEGSAGAPGGAGSGAGAGGLPVILAFADVQDGEVRFVDRATGMERTVRHIDFTATDVSLDSEVSFDLRAAALADEHDVHVRGRVGPVGPLEGLEAGRVPLSIEIEAGPVAALELLSLLPPDPDRPALEASGRLEARASAGGSLGAIEFDARVDATEAGLRVGDMFDKPPGVAAVASFGGVVKDGVVDLLKIALDVGGVTLTGSGSLGEDVRLEMGTKGAALAGLASLVPALAGGRLEGTFSLDADVERQRDAAPRVGATYSASVASFDLAALRPPPAGGADAPRAADVLRDLSVEGRLRTVGPGEMANVARATSSSGTLSGIDYTGLSANIRTAGDTVVVERYSAKALDGTIEGSGAFRPAAQPPSFVLSTRTRGVDVAQYLRHTFSGTPAAIEGRVDLDLDVGGTGRTWEDAQKTITGSGTGVVLEGVLLEINIANEIVNGIQTIPLVPAEFGQRMRERNPGLFRDNRTAFQNLAGSVEIRDGRVETGDLSAHTPYFDIVGGGWFGFDRRMDMRTTLVLSSQLTGDVVDELPAARYLLRADGRLELPLTIAGETTRPTITVDTDLLSARLQEALLQEGSDALRDRLGDAIKGFGKRRKK